MWSESVSDIAMAKKAYYTLYKYHLQYGIAVLWGITVGNHVLKHQYRREIESYWICNQDRPLGNFSNNYKPQLLN